jgi:hypothetical protein
VRRIRLAIGGATLLAAVFAGTVAAADPTPSPSPSSEAGTTVSGILGLTQAEIADMRQDGLSLADIAVKQDVDPDRLVNALVERWTERIAFRAANGALTADEATALRAQLETHARDLVHRTTLGGMQGVAVGAGRGAAGSRGAELGMGQGQGPRGSGAGTGVCDGTGPHGRGSR